MGNNQVDWDLFGEFANNGQVGAFGRALFPAPERGESYNDDAVLPLYESSLRSYAGAQRKGIRGERPSSTNVHEHVLEALQSPFFHSQSTPIPPITDRAVEFSAASCPRAVSAFWKTQLGRSEQALDVRRGVAASWGARRPLDLRPLRAGNVLMLDFPIRRFKLGWVG